MDKRVVIIDYGMGNLHSVYNAFSFIGADPVITADPQEILDAHHVVLPGVGHFADAMQELAARGLIKPIIHSIETGTPFLGICLGFQLLFETSDEAPGVKGLGVFSGNIEKFSGGQQHELKVPHMGWNAISLAVEDCPLMNNVPSGSYVYFVHSYYVPTSIKEGGLTKTEYGEDFYSSMWKGNVFATQFHPEKSQCVGLTMLKNFMEVS